MLSSNLKPPEKQNGQMVIVKVKQRVAKLCIIKDNEIFLLNQGQEIFSLECCQYVWTKP